MFAYRQYQAALYRRERITDLMMARQTEVYEHLTGKMIPE